MTRYLPNSQPLGLVTFGGSSLLGNGKRYIKLVRLGAVFLFMPTSCFWSAGKPVSRISFYSRTHCYASLRYQYLIALVKLLIGI